MDFKKREITLDILFLKKDKACMKMLYKLRRIFCRATARKFFQEGRGEDEEGREITPSPSHPS